MPELLRVNQWVSLLQEFLHCNGLGLFWCCAVTVLDHLCVIFLEAFDLGSIAKAINIYSAYNKLLTSFFCSSQCQLCSAYPEIFG